MDTRFEINIGKIGIKGNDNSLYIFYQDRLYLKLAYKDMTSAYVKVRSIVKRLSLESATTEENETIQTSDMK